MAVLALAQQPRAAEVGELELGAAAAVLGEQHVLRLGVNPTPNPNPNPNPTWVSSTFSGLVLALPLTQTLTLALPG